MPLNPLLRQGTRAVTNSLTSHRLLLYGAVSTIAVCAAVANALRNYTNFYSVAIYLSRSSSSVLIFANFGFILALLFGHIVQRIFFGPLRANEVERLYDRLWIFVTESLLAFTIFRDEFDAPFALMFGSLLFIKSFHWLASDRIEWMDQQPYPGPSVLFHVRMSTLFLILWLADLSMLLFAVENTLTYGVGGMVLFACEYGILLATAANIIAKYALSCYDFHRAGTRGGENAPPWEQKSIWTFYFELVTDFSKLTTYLCFFTIILTFYGLPLNIVRDIYFTARSFVTRLKALRRYQTATRNMDERYPNATPEEMAESDHTCIICREEMVLPTPDQPTAEGPNTTPKKLPCGHIFHFHCLRSWLERQQSCPTCRRTVLETTPPDRAVAAPRQPAQAAPPAPAGTPAPNAHPPPGAQNANAGHGNANNAPMDLIRRLVNNNNNNQLQNRGNGANGALNVIIQYDIHNYGPGGRPEPRVAATSHAPLRRPQQFTGFQGPGGVWQPWNIDGVEIPNQEAGTGVADTPAAPTSQPTPTTPLETAPETTPESPPAAPETTVTSPDLTETQPETVPSAREAAAQAALRRLNSSSSSSSNSGAESSGQPTPSTSTPPPSIEASSSSIPSTSSNGDVPTPHTNTPTVPVSTPIPGGIKLPSLIPLDLNPNLSRRDLPRNPPRVQRQRPAPSLSQLPPVTTPEQLAMMDRVTREAIDERLRVLEGVSGAVYRCIDELMKMRSTLPAPTAAPVAAPAQHVAEGSSSSAAPIPTPTVAEQILEPEAGQPAVEDERQEQEVV